MTFAFMGVSAILLLELELELELEDFSRVGRGRKTIAFDIRSLSPPRRCRAISRVWVDDIGIFFDGVSSGTWDRYSVVSP